MFPGACYPHLQGLCSPGLDWRSKILCNIGNYPSTGAMSNTRRLHQHYSRNLESHKLIVNEPLGNFMIYTLAKYYEGNLIKKDKLGSACDMLLHTKETIALSRS